MTERILWGILGTAAIARSCILPAIQKSNNSTAYALATRTPQSAEELCEQHNIQFLYASFDELLADPRVEVIYNSLPNHLHHSVTLRALQAGKHVLCEKPLACSEAEAAAGCGGSPCEIAAHGILVLPISSAFTRNKKNFLPMKGVT